MISRRKTVASPKQTGRVPAAAQQKGAHASRTTISTSTIIPLEPRDEDADNSNNGIAGAGAGRRRRRGGKGCFLWSTYLGNFLLLFFVVFHAARIYQWFHGALELWQRVAGPLRPMPNRTLMMYVSHHYRKEDNVRKISNLYHSFGPNQFFIVTDKKEEETKQQEEEEEEEEQQQDKEQQETVLQIPATFFSKGHEVPVIGPAQQAVTEHARWNWAGKGLERAVMYLVDHADDFDYAWIMEEDVYWQPQDAGRLHQLWESTIDKREDLLHFNPTSRMEQTPHEDFDFWHCRALQPPAVTPLAAFQVCHWGRFMLYRISSQMIVRLNHWRVERNGGNWTFFEPLLGSFAMTTAAAATAEQPALTTASVLDPDRMQFRYRPCFTKKEVSKSGKTFLFHPVKLNFIKCNSEGEKKTPSRNKKADDDDDDEYDDKAVDDDDDDDDAGQQDDDDDEEPDDDDDDDDDEHDDKAVDDDDDDDDDAAQQDDDDDEAATVSKE